MKPLTALTLLSLIASLSACALNGAYTEDQAQADALKQCEFYDTQKQRTHCMKEIVKQSEDARRQEVERFNDKVLAKEDEMARREAHGLPTY